MDLAFYLETPPWDWPPESGKVFLKVLSDGEAKEADRLIAAELAGDATVINEALSEALLAVVGDSRESEALRAKAASSLGPVLEMADTADPEDPYSLAEAPIGEALFEDIKATLQRVYDDAGTPKLVRRRILEASVRANQDWHRGAIRKAWATGDREWVLTAVFAMNYVRGFDTEILEALKSTDQDTRCEAISAAGNWEIAAAWPHVRPLLKSSKTPKPLLLAAIDAASGICPQEAEELLNRFANSKDEEISDAAEEALMLIAPIDEDELDDIENLKPPKWIN